MPYDPAQVERIPAMPRADRRVPWPERGIYAVTPEHRSGAELTAAVASAVEHGVRAVQYRDKSADLERRRRDAEALLEVCRARNVPLIINDDVDLALAAGADGVHLGRDDEALADARSRLGDDTIIGVSCYDEPDRALAAARNGADYVAFGSFFPSVTKPGAVRATAGLVAAVRPRIGVPIVAIGGITPENAPPLLECGVDLLAIVNAIFGAPDIAQAVRRLARLMS